MRAWNEKRIIDYAVDRYTTEDIEIDHDPKLSDADEGCWVQAWVWVPYEEVFDENHLPNE